jgi:hypothetical protein
MCCDVLFWAVLWRVQASNSDQQVRLMVEMLESYDREIQSLEGSINEAEEDLDNTR